MTLVSCLLAGLVALAIFGFIFWHPRDLNQRASLLESHLKDRFVVTLTTGETFDGLLIEVDADTLLLADARLHTGDRWTPADGQVYVPRSKVAYLQATMRQVTE